MRIASLRLLAWGRFDREELELGPSGKLTVVYGPNEAGKSTALRGLFALLFGIPRGTPDSYLHGAAEVRVGARLVAEDGATLDLVRRRGARPPVVDAEGKAVTEERLSALLGGVGREAFGTMFGLDHVRLREGAQALASGRGELGEALLSAATGTVSLHRTLTELRRTSEATYTPRAPRRPLLAAVRAFHEAKRRVRELEVLPHGWLESEARIAEEERREAELEAERGDLVARRARVRAVRELAPLLARRAELERELDALSHVRGVSPDLGARREELERDLERCGLERDALVSRLESLESRLARLPDARSLRGREAELELLRACAARFDAAEPLRVRALIERERVAAEPVESELVASLDPRLAALAGREAELRPLAREELRLRSRAEALAERRVALEARERSLSGATASQEPPSTEASDEALARALERARAATSQALVAAESRSIEQTSAERARLLARVPGGAEALALLPTAEALLRVEAESADVARARAALSGRRERCSARRSEVLAAIDAERSRGPLPDVQALAAARAERSRLLGELVAADGKRRRLELSRELERVMEDVDARVDAVGRERDRLAQADRLAEELAKLDAELASHDGAERDLGARADAVSDVLRSWLASPAAPRGAAPSLDEVRARLGLARDIAHAERELASAREARRVSEERREQALSALAASLGPSASPAVELLGAATAELERRRRARQAALTDELARSTLARERAELERVEADAARQHELFDAAWRGVLAGLGVTDERVPSVADALEVASALDAAERRRRSRGELDAILSAAEEARRELAAAVRGLLDAAPDGGLAERAPRLAAQHVLELARLEAAERGPLELERETLRPRLERLRREAEVLRSRLAALATEVGATGAEALARVEADVARRLEVEQELAQLEARVSGRLEGQEPELLELLGLPPSALADEDARLEEREADLEGELRRSRQRAAGARVGQERMGLGQSAEAEAEVAESSLASARALAFEWAVQRVMLALASAEMERYRTEHKGPLLERASSALRALTQGAYEGVDAVVEGGVPSLVCLRRERRGGRDDLVPVGVPALSDGTLDQLYLALRIATWEAHARTRVPLPVVLDDVLVHFDDDRSAGALVALAELARSLQVVVFTHHRRVLELARASLGPSSLHEATLHAG